MGTVSYFTNKKMKQSSFLPQRKILGSYFFLFLLSSVGAQEVPNDSNEEIDVPISTLNITNSDQVGQNATLNTTETRPKCKQILKNFFDESVNETRPLIEETVLNATKNFLTDEVIPDLNDAIQTEVVSAENRLTGLINAEEAKIVGFEQLIETMEKRMTQENENLKGLMALKDTEIAQLKRRLTVLETKVIFSAVRASGYNFQGDITYDRLDVSIGGGFDIRSGVFVVPTSGVYRLSFSAQSGSEKYKFTRVYIKKNGSTIFNIWDSNEADDINNISYTWVMNLTQGDRVNLSSVKHLYANSYTPVTFTGELIHI